MGKLNTYPDKVLVQMLKEGNIEAFDALYFRYIPRLQGFIRVYTKDRILSEELLQEVFLKIWEKKETLDENLCFKAYLFQIIKNSILNVFRKKVINFSIEATPEARNITCNNLEEQLDFDELQEKTLEIIEALPDVQRQIFKMSKVHGMRNDEISASLNISKRTVEHHIYLALKTVKNKLTLSDILSFLLLVCLL